MTKKAPHPNSHAAKLAVAQEALRVQLRDNADMMERIAALCRQNDELQNLNTDLAVEKHSLSQRLADMTSAAAAHEHNADEYQKACDRQLTAARECRRELENAEKAASDARATIDRLKKQLLDAELETARLRGYIQRVAEDDVAREVRHETQRTEAHSGRQPLTPRTGGFMGASDDNGGYRGRHWTGL